MLNKMIPILLLTLTISGCATNQESSVGYPIKSCYVGPLNFEKEGAVNHLTICMKNDNKITASLSYPNQFFHEKSEKPTVCSSEGVIKKQDKESYFLITTEKGMCANGRSFNSFSIDCELKTVDSLVCRHNQFPNEINLTTVQ